MDDGVSGGCRRRVAVTAATATTAAHPRAILHIDIDCFYAQVEMLRRPGLRDQPVGVQQKSLLVTCNYRARALGVAKCQPVQEALAVCPGLVLVNGEDLAEYRKASQQVHEILLQFSPHVEKLGLDENFVDVTEVVERMLSDEEGAEQAWTVKGERVFDAHAHDDVGCPCGCARRLAVASHVAQRVRARIYEQVGLTTCAGIAHNKLLAKLACPMHKPDQQTCVFPWQAKHVLDKLGSVRGLPGVGESAERLLAAAQVFSVTELRNASAELLKKTLGPETAGRLQALAAGVDEAPVKRSGRPRSLGVEDSFGETSVETEIRERLRGLIQRLLKLQAEDGRLPGAIKVTVRRWDPGRRRSHRESRQGNTPQLAPTALLTTCMRLFHKMINLHQAFHITLLGVAFTKFHERRVGRGSIASFLSKDLSVQSLAALVHGDAASCAVVAANVSSPALTMTTDGSESESEPSPKKPRDDDASPLSQEDVCRKRPFDDSPTSPATLRQVARLRLSESTTPTAPMHCPDDVDSSVFAELPSELQRELADEWAARLRERRPNGGGLQPSTSTPLLQYDIRKYFIPNQ